MVAGQTSFSISEVNQRTKKFELHTAISSIAILNKKLLTVNFSRGKIKGLAKLI